MYCPDTNINYTADATVHFLEEGKEYVIKNADSDLYLGVDNKTEAGSHVWQETDFFYDSQKFRFESVNKTTPYLYIKNINSGLYLGVENNSTAHDAAVKLYAKNTSAEGQRFKITKTTGNKIQIMPKTGESGSTQRVLSPLNSLILNFNMICQRNINSDNISREWILISKNDAVLIGIPDEGHDHHSFMNPVTQNLTSLGYDSINSFTNITPRTALAYMAQSKIFVSRSHGNKSCILLNNNQRLTIDNMSKLGNNSLSYTELVLYGACLTGEGGENAINLVTTTYSKGAKTVIGFRISTWCGETTDWTNAFFDALEDGKSTWNASISADTAITYKYPDPTTNLSNRLFVGDKNKVFN